MLCLVSNTAKHRHAQNKAQKQLSAAREQELESPALEVPSHKTLPRWVELLVHLLLDVSCTTG